MKENRMPLACVLGEIDLVRALGHAGISCAVAAVPGDPARYSRHTVARVPWFHPLERSEAMLASLMDWGARQARRPVLYFNGDHDLLLVSRNRRALGRFFDFAIAESELVEDLVDKERFSELARRLELPVPANVCVDPLARTPEDVDVAFPAAIKPLMRRHEVWNAAFGGAKALRAGSSEELRDVWPALQSQGKVIVQTLIEGSEARVESYHVYVDANGDRLCEFTGRKLRTSPPAFGETTALEITERRDVVEAGRAVIDRLKLTGVAKLDFKRDGDGRLWLLEVNPRFNLWHHAGAVAGANIPRAVYDDLTAGSRIECSVRAPVTWCHPTRDAREARRAGMGPMKWARWAIGCDAKWALSAKDPMPFLRGVIMRRLRSKLGAR